MRSNNRITKLLIHIDIQLFTLHLIGICFHLNISLLNIVKKMKEIVPEYKSKVSKYEVLDKR